MSRLAIFNGFPFHYEMFGYIINYCVVKRFELTIYTTTQNDLGWIQFYRSFFQKGIPNFVPFIIKPVNMFNSEFRKYDLIILTTDDDPAFKDGWISEKVVKISHVNFERRPLITKTIYNRPYDIVAPWALPCFPIVNVDDKLTFFKKGTGDINILLIGYYSTYEFDIFNRMVCADGNDRKIVLHFISRRTLPFQSTCCERLKSNISTKFYVNIDTNDMFKLLGIADYLCIECSSHPTHHYESMSGAIPTSFSCLTPLIIDKNMNSYYKFQNAIEYNTNSSEPIILFAHDKYVETIRNMDSERETLVSMLSTILDNFLVKNYNIDCIGRIDYIALSQKNKICAPTDKYVNTALIVEPRKLDRLSEIIKQYRTVLGNSWNIVFYCGKGLKTYWSPLLEDVVAEIRELSVDNLNSNQYNDFLKSKELWESLTGEYVLVFQSDSWIHFHPVYNIKFFIGLNKSYIGGNMSYHWNELLRENIHLPFNNFNGGLSLRKREVMITIINHFPPKPTIVSSRCMETDAEDVYFTIGANNLGFLIGDDEPSSHFAVHTIFKNEWFGIHSPNRLVKPLLLQKFPEISVIY
jgi:hypothetical protein